MQIMTKISACLMALGLLAGCLPEEGDSVTEVENIAPISIAQKSATSWVSAAEMTGTDVSRADDILATNNMVVLDMSGSMDTAGCSGQFATRADAAKDALFKWITANPGGNVGLVAFNSSQGAELLHGLGSGDAHGRKVIETIRGIHPDQGTPLSTAIEMAEGELKSQFIRQNGSGTYRMIVITDGEASKGYDPTPVVRRIAADPTNPIELHTIGFCIKGRHSLKDPNAVFYVDASTPEDIVKGLNATQGEGASFSADDLNFEELTQ
tara:strand:+ start:175 stop:975 length:801 start_codon:yes stop_codon:yes gene_type:complete